MIISLFIRNLFPGSLKDLLLALSRKAINRKLKSIPVSDSGISNSNIPYIRLKNGLTFYGYLPSKLQRFYYRHFIDENIKSSICEDSFAVAQDIIIRYEMPDAAEEYLTSGKYFDLKEGDIVVECGAYIGFYAIRAAQIVGKSGHVFAIEPIKENLIRLNLNVNRNAFENITIIPFAVWKDKTSLPIYREQKQRASLVESIVKHNEVDEVQCDSLDNMLSNYDLKKIDFVRIQVNGAEIEALLGMKETLDKNPKLLITSLYQKTNLGSREVVSYLNKLGYETIEKGPNVFAWKK